MDTAENIESSDAIKAKIEETRADLGEKLGTLENEVRSTISNASATVNEKISGIKEAFTVKHYVTERPWLAMGVAVTAGVALGIVLKSRGNRSAPGSYVNTSNSGDSNYSNSLRSLVLGSALGFLGNSVKEAVSPSLRPLFDRAIDEVGNTLGVKPK